MPRADFGGRLSGAFRAEGAIEALFPEGGPLCSKGMVEMEVNYEGDLHTRAVHGPSGNELATDAPVDNQGRGAAFSPTDLAATALGTCVLTTMGIAAQRKGVEMKGSKARVLKEMSADAPRRIARIVVEVEVPLPADHPERAFLEAAGRGCPVARSLHPEVIVEKSFAWVG